MSENEVGEKNPIEANSSNAANETTGQTASVVTAPVSREPRVWQIYSPINLAGHVEKIFIASFPPIVFFWPLVLLSFFCGLTQYFGLLSPSFLAWSFLVVAVLNCLVLVQELDQKQFAILALAVSVLGLLVWVVSLLGFTFLQSFFAWFFSFNPEINTSAYALIFMGLASLFLWGAVIPLFDYWVLEPNEFVHYAQPVGRDMSVARLGCTIYKEIPDIWQCLLTFGGGTLIIKKDNQVLAHIKNVPFLSRRMDAIEHMLSETRVTVTN